MFNIGEEVEVIGVHVERASWVEAMVVGRLEVSEFTCIIGESKYNKCVPCYLVQVGDKEFAAEPPHIRKRPKKGKKEGVAEWEDCVWQPDLESIKG